MICKSKIWKNLGKLPLCNLKEDTTFHIGNFCFPLCYRCTAIIICASCGNYLLQKYLISWQIFLIGLILILPCVIDGILQYNFRIKSTNKRRIITGMFAGFGASIVYKYCIEKIFIVVNLLV